MRKLSLFVLASLFSIGVIAQTTPAATTKPTDAKAIPVSNSKAGNKSNKVASTSSKNNVKKIGANKTTIHHVTPVKKTVTSATKDASQQDSNQKK